MCNSPRVHPCGVPTAYEGAQTLFIHPIWKWTAVSGSVQPQPRHHGSIWAPPTIWTPPDPNLPNIPLTLTCVKAQWCTNMAFQQHLKVLKNFLYIQYGGGKQSVVVYSLNHDIMAAFGLRHTHIYFATQPELDMW